MSTATVRAFRSFVLAQHGFLSAVLGLTAVFRPWVVLGADVTSSCFVALTEVVTSTAIRTDPSFSSRPEPVGFVASAPKR